MATIEHYYRCLGCGRRHEIEATAKVCCAVVQEIFACVTCKEEFPTPEKVKEHARTHDAQPVEDFATGQSFAGGAGNFATI